MKRLALSLLMLFALSAAARPEQSADASAASIALRVQALTRAQIPLDTVAKLQSREELLRLASALEAGSEPISPHARMQLQTAIDELENLGVEQSLYRRSPLANGTISGVLRDALSGLPLTIANSMRVQATEFSSQIVPGGAGIINNVLINAQGQYSLSLPPGSYHVRTLTNMPGMPYINQAFGFGNCADSIACPRYVGTIVTVPDGGASIPVNFDMPLGGRISGNLKRQDTQANLPNVIVIARLETGGAQANVPTDVNGNFLISGLLPGRYRVSSAGNVPQGLLQVVYPNVPCGDNDCDTVPGSTLVTVSGTATTSGINLAASAGAASIAGVISNAENGTPIVDDGSFRSLVYLISEDRGTFLQMPLTQATGEYQAPRLRPGNYRVVAVAPGFIGKVVLSTAPTVTTRDCVDPLFCDALDIGGAVTLAPGGALTNLNFSLDRGATVTGTVRAAVGATPIANATVTLESDFANASGLTDALGQFSVRGLQPGVYYASVDALPQNFVRTWLGDVPCRGFECLNVGIPITLSANQTRTGVNFNMPVGGTLSGLIIDGASGLPAPRQTRLELFTANSRTAVVQVFSTGLSGYVATGLPAGAYKAVFASESVLGWVDTAFGGLPCPRGGCDLALLPTIAVSSGSTTAGIGATLLRGPRVSGRIVEALSGEPIRPLAFGSGLSNLLAFNNNLSNYAGFARVTLSGHYQSRTGLPPGPYFLSTFLLRNNTTFGGGYIDQMYLNRPCPFGSCGLASGTPITIAASDLSGFDIALNRGGAIAGTVRAASNAQGLNGVGLTAYNASGNVVATARSNPRGSYRLDGLPSGSYFVATNNAQGFQDALFNGQNCEPFCNPVSGTPIMVNGTATTANRDFALLQSVSIGGVVSDSGPASNVAVELYGQIGNLLSQVVSANDGSYRFNGLAPGRFYVRTRNAFGRTDDLYWQAGNPQNTQLSKPDCVGEACRVRAGTPIDALDGSNFNTANLALSAPGMINGLINNAADASVISGVSVELLDARGARVGLSSSSASGSYRFSALAAGTYYLVSRGTSGFVDKAYPNAPCAESCNGLAGSPISVGLGVTVNGINLSLARGGAISGVVRNALNSQPLAAVTVQVYNAAGLSVAQVASAPNGAYSLPNLPDGTFFVRTQNALGFINEVHNNRSCGGYCDLLNGTPVVISGANSLVGINFDLDAGGSISGRLSNANSVQGIALAEVVALDANGLVSARASSNALGDFNISGLQPGIYKLRTSNAAGYINQVYRTPSALPCSPSPCALSAGTPIAVSGAVAGINLALTPGGTISGTAADLFNNPLPSGTAVLLDASGGALQSIAISGGNFEFNGLANGSYYVLIRNNSGLIDLLFPNVPCPAGACNVLAVGTPIVLDASRATSAAQAVANIDLRLPAGRAISGRVTRLGAPLAEVTVYFFNPLGAVVGSGISDAQGNYSVRETLPAGPNSRYFAATASPGARGAAGGLINKAWNNVPCMLDCDVVAIGAAIVLPAAIAALPNIDFDLSPGGGLSGQVRSSLGAALALVTVEVVDANGRIVGITATDSLGHYTLDGLVSGNYFARTRNTLGLLNQVYGGGPCANSCAPLNGTPITVSGTVITSAIDFQLLPSDALFINGFEE